MTSQGTTPLTLVESAARLGHYRYVELALFVILGEAAPDGVSAAATVALAQASRSHAYRAEQFAARLPVSVGLKTAAECTVSPGPAVEEFLDALRAALAVDLPGVLSDVLYPAMTAAYRHHLERCSPVADRPIALALTRSLDELGRVGPEIQAARPEAGGQDVGFSSGLAELLRVAKGPFGPLPTPTDWSSPTRSGQIRV